MSLIAFAAILGLETPDTRTGEKGNVTGTMFRHANFGGGKCCGCLYGITLGNQAAIVCNECEAVIRTVPAADLQQVLTEMERAVPMPSRAAGKI